MSSYVIKEKTGWQSCQAEQKYPERHDPAKMILTVCMCFLHVIKTACKFTSVYSWACCRPLPCSLAPILPFLLSQLSLPLRQISLCIICGCFLAGVWFVRLESWQSVFDHADPPLHGWACLTAGRPTRGFNVGEMERQRSVTERCGSVKKKKRLTFTLRGLKMIISLKFGRTETPCHTACFCSLPLSNFSTSFDREAHIDTRKWLCAHFYIANCSSDTFSTGPSVSRDELQSLTQEGKRN